MRKQIVLILISILVVIIMTSCNTNGESTNAPTVTQGSQTSMLELTIQMDRDVHSLSDNIQVKMKLKNIGDEILIINGRMAPNFSSAPDLVRDIVFVITSPSGKDIQPAKYIGARPPKDDDFVELEAGGSIEKSFELGLIYNFTEIGQYSIRAIYQNVVDPESWGEAWKGEIRSNIITFGLKQ
jgi:hypothetical protein